MNKSYYHSYEDRYKKAYESGVRLWGNSRNDETLVKVLTDWVNKNNLFGRKVVEFACGEGEIGVILSELGCQYQGYDIAPSAIDKASVKLAGYGNSYVELKDLVKEPIKEKYDALLDVMGFHMMVTDSDRDAYLKNAYNCLKDDSPILFYREVLNADAYDGYIENIEQYIEVSKYDYVTPDKREVSQDGKIIEVYVPLIPARARSIEGYKKEFASAGFTLEKIIDLAPDRDEYKSAAIYGHKKAME